MYGKAGTDPIDIAENSKITSVTNKPGLALHSYTLVGLLGYYTSFSAYHTHKLSLHDSTLYVAVLL